jgi:F-type H+-transporting ATPase subunit b
MELSWSTFLLEMVNFLVLVWLLKRFLYKPVQDAIARRRETIEQTLEGARAERRTGEALQTRYQNRLADWERERETARNALHAELEAERHRRLEALEAELEQGRDRTRVLAQRERREMGRRLEGEALALGARFASRLLSRLAGPALESRLVEMALQDLEALPDGQRQTLRRAWDNGDGPVQVTSTYPLQQGPRQALEGALAKLVGAPVTCSYRQDPALIGGLRLRLSAWVLHANLQDELRSFAEAGRE